MRPDIEHELARRACPEPSDGFRDRILAAVSAERRAPAPRRSRWAVVWKAAAAVVLVCNLGMAAANGLRYQRLAAPAVAPESLESGDRFSAFAAGALTQLTPGPDVGVLSRRFLEQTK